MCIIWSREASWRLKGKCHEIFDFRFFYESVYPKPLSIPLGPFCRCHWHRQKFATSVVDIGGASWLVNIFANFPIKSKWPKCYFQGLGEDDSWKKIEAKISWHCLFNIWSQKPLSLKPRQLLHTLCTIRGFWELFSSSHFYLLLCSF